MKLTSGRKEPCKDNIGGVKEIHLMTYVEYDVRSIVGYRDLFITSFPPTQIYKYEGNQKTFDETYNEDGYYIQEINIRLIDQNIQTAQLLSILLKNKVRAVVTDWKGNRKLAGVINGLDVEVTTNTGGGKSDFNGYSIKLTGLEELQSPFITSLEDAGITEEDLGLSCILSSSDRPSSISDLVSSCNSIPSAIALRDCLKSSSDRSSSLSQLVSSCNIAV